jgi:hypothetical protein
MCDAMYQLIIDLSILSMLIINLIVLMYIGGFLVQLKNDQRAFMADLIEAIDGLLGSSKSSGTPRGKTWDQKFEEELEDVQRRRRQDPGLMDTEVQ